MDRQQTTSEPTRIAELEALVSRLRHDLRGVMTPAALIGDQLRKHADPAVQRAGTRIGETVQRVLDRLEATYSQVPPYSVQPAGSPTGTDPGSASGRQGRG